MGKLAVKFTVVEAYPPAKLNLFLELLGKRGDGFHELQTVMVAIDRCDAIRVVGTEQPSVELVCRWSPSPEVWRQQLPTAAATTFELPPVEDNLVTRALQRFREVYRWPGGFRVQLEKRIPAGAGMGGASSDAAAALLAAATLCGVERTDPPLVEIAAELGSDIPFFLAPAVDADGPRQRGGIAFAAGRGELLTALAAAPRLHFVIIYPPEPLSTARVFSQCRIPGEPQCAQDWLAPLAGADWRSIPPLFNRLAEPARGISGWIERAIAALTGLGLRGATMTGSGSACFALADSARAARRAALLLSARRMGVCFAAAPISLPATIRNMT